MNAQTPEYLEYFGLREAPFALTPDPAFLFLTESHQRALEGLAGFVSRGEGYAVLYGDIGTGKTTLCRALLERLHPNVETALIVNPFLDEADLLRAVASDLGVPVQEPSGERANTQQLLATVGGFLAETRRGGKRCAVIMDEAHNLPIPALEQLRVIGNLETNKEKLLQVILVGQEELMDLLSSPRVTQLHQRIARWFHLDPLTPEDIELFFRFRMERAGMVKELKITREASAMVHRLTSGYPRLLNMLFDRALTHVAQKRKWVVDAEDVRVASEQMPLRQSKSSQSVAGLKKRLVVQAAVAAGLALALFFAGWFGMKATARKGIATVPPRDPVAEAPRFPAGTGAPAPSRPAPPAQPAAQPEAPPARTPSWVCCVGEFGARDAAIAALKAIAAGAVEGKRFVVSPVDAAPGAVHLACIGPFANREDARKAMDALAALKIKSDIRDASQWNMGSPKP